MKKFKFNGSKMRNEVDAWVLMLPMVILVFIFVWRPTVIGGVWSFFRMQGYSVENFCGIDNYRMVLTNTNFVPILLNTAEYVFWSLIIGFLPPLFIAVMINEMIHFKKGFRVLIYIPAVIPGIAAMLIWYFIYYPDQTGLLNMLLSKLGVAPYEWLNDPDFAIIGIVIYMSWKGFAGTMLLYLAALQGVSTELYEASLADGAGPFRRLWYVTRPAIEGLLLLNVVRQIISVFQVLEPPMAMTGGGPNGASTSLSYQLYEYGFNSGGKGTGQAMALGVIIFGILMIFNIFYFALNRKVEDRY
ncbi:MAG TPA: sugar ABC transporter permease [Candidatus Ornithomonoglobus intestinigallinarum]|uniref:Sugar ABC transporter permease n=1 Tax=Candidatus Ornithomonoglobus intestinigallinarum TaxID=2840894 RepID=A0A9D1KRR4_9FIRM|nr:sugar ABC transporter permease [Candidatus Ornithomonoglobus intestinigallinarum]